MPHLEIHRVTGDPDDRPARTRSHFHPLTGRIAPRPAASFSATATTR